MLTCYLDTNFKTNKRVALEALVERTSPGSIIPKGSLVVMASGDRRLRLKILDKDTLHKNLSEPLVLNTFAAEHKVTPHYLLWFMSREAVANYLVERATGAVFIRVPRPILHALPVPLPTSVKKIKSTQEFSIIKTNNEFSALLADLYSDYMLNAVNHRYRTSAVLAGAICEVILYQLLVEQGVNKTLLKNDRGLGIGKLLDYSRVLKLDETPGFPMSQLVELQKTRNNAVHAGLLVNKTRKITREDLAAFDPIIKYFGI